jgi:hypothetical protein
LTSDDELLRERYAREPNEALLEALQRGPSDYTPAAWRVIVAEIRTRGLATMSAASHDQPSARPEALQQESRASAQIPTWLSRTFIVPGVGMLAIQSLLLLSYLGVASTNGLLLLPASSLAYGVAAWTASRVARRGAPDAAKYLGWASIAEIVVGLLAHARR